MRYTTTRLRLLTMEAMVGLVLLALPLPTHAHTRVSVGMGRPASRVVAPPPPVAGRYSGVPHRPERQRHWRPGH
jgi:hypothetical protein